MAYAAGVDVGSTQTKAVLIDASRNIVARALTETGANVTRAAETAFQQALAAADVREEEVEYVVGTGYGRYKVTFGNTQVTEISCHGRGAVHMFPNTGTVVDMGGTGHKGDPRLGAGGDRRFLHERQVRRQAYVIAPSVYGWWLSSSDCPASCPCSAPPRDPYDACETYKSGCYGTTSTTAAPTSTTTGGPTTTTTCNCSPCAPATWGNSTWLCNDGAWVLCNANCPPGEGPEPPAASCLAGDCICHTNGTCQITTSTTTTPARTTTTTPAPTTTTTPAPTTTTTPAPTTTTPPPTTTTKGGMISLLAAQEARGSAEGASKSEQEEGKRAGTALEELATDPKYQTIVDNARTAAGKMDVKQRDVLARMGQYFQTGVKAGSGGKDVLKSMAGREEAVLSGKEKGTAVEAVYAGAEVMAAAQTEKLWETPPTKEGEKGKEAKADLGTLQKSYESLMRLQLKKDDEYAIQINKALDTINNTLKARLPG